MTAPDVDALRAEAQRLYAAHQAVLAEITPRQDARTAEIEAAGRRHSAAIDAFDAALDRETEAYEALRRHPGDPDRRAAVETARQAADAAFAHAEAEGRAARDLQFRLIDEGGADTNRLLAAGARFRAAQDDMFLAEMAASAAIKEV